MSDGASLSGKLEFLGLGDLLQLLGANGCTGELRLRSKYSSEVGKIFIDRGNPVNGQNGSLSGLDAVTSLFGWTVGEFEFETGPIHCEPVINKSRMSIILDSLSLLDEGEIERLGPVSYGRRSKRRKSPDGHEQLPTIRGPLVDYIYVVDEEEFTDGQKIALEGKHGNWIWVILDGIVEIEKTMPHSGQTVKLLRLGEGAFLGSTTSFKIEGNVRSASAIASGDVLLGVMDAQRLADEFTRLTPAFRGIVDSLDRRLRDVSRHAAEIHFGKNTAAKMIRDMKAVIKQGDPEEKVFTVSSGNGYLIRQTKYGQLPLARLLPGDVFGRLPFLDIGHEPDAAAVFGSEDLRVKPLEARELQREFSSLSTTFRHLLEHMATSITVTTRLLANFQRWRHSADGKK